MAGLNVFKQNRILLWSTAHNLKAYSARTITLTVSKAEVRDAQMKMNPLRLKYSDVSIKIHRNKEHVKCTLHEILKVKRLKLKILTFKIFWTSWKNKF